MERIDLDKYRRRPHPYRAIFRKHKVTNAVVANFLGKSFQYTTNMLSGSYPMTPKIEKQLKPLVDQLQQEDGQ